MIYTYKYSDDELQKELVDIADYARDHYSYAIAEYAEPTDIQKAKDFLIDQYSRSNDDKVNYMYYALEVFRLPAYWSGLLLSTDSFEALSEFLDFAEDIAMTLDFGCAGVLRYEFWDKKYVDYSGVSAEEMCLNKISELRRQISIRYNKRFYFDNSAADDDMYFNDYTFGELIERAIADNKEKDYKLFQDFSELWGSILETIFYDKKENADVVKVGSIFIELEKLENNSDTFESIKAKLFSIRFEIMDEEIREGIIVILKELEVVEIVA